MKDLFFPEKHNRQLLKFQIYSFVVMVSLVIFTIFSFPLGINLSTLAMPVNIIFALFVVKVYSSFLKKYKTDTPVLSRQITVYKKILEYLPFIMLATFVLQRFTLKKYPFAIDIIQVSLWLVVFVFSLLLLNLLSKKKQESVFVDTIFTARKKNFFISCLEWIDALIQAAFLVLLINIFIFQLYEIPSESMVPTFMIKDKVFVFKTLSAPKFPMTEISLPPLRKYDRGDIVLLKNPKYERTPKTEAKTFLSQFLYMITATKVNIDKTDEMGRMKADPLVKRITGIPGEQLVMVGGVLYHRNDLDSEFVPVTEDSIWSNWLLSDLPAEDKEYIAYYPLSLLDPSGPVYSGMTASDLWRLEKENYEQLLFVEDEIKHFSLEEISSNCRKAAMDFANLQAEYGKKSDREFTYNDSFFNVFSLSGGASSPEDTVARNLLNSSDGSDFFTSFMTEWIETAQLKRDPFESYMFKLNSLIKLTYGRLIVEKVKSIVHNSSIEYLTDSYVSTLKNSLRRYVMYMMLNDQRNMPVFPKDSLIPENCFFMMGDNRFNSLDLRHSYSYHKESLDKNDKYSFWYNSNLEPQYINKSDILGTAIFRFWPPKRAGIL